MNAWLFDNDEDENAPKIHYFRDLQDPFNGLSEREIYRRYRFPRAIILELTDLLKGIAMFSVFYLPILGSLGQIFLYCQREIIF